MLQENGRGRKETRTSRMIGFVVFVLKKAAWAVGVCTYCEWNARVLVMCLCERTSWEMCVLGPVESRWVCLIALGLADREVMVWGLRSAVWVSTNEREIGPWGVERSRVRGPAARLGLLGFCGSVLFGYN